MSEFKSGMLLSSMLHLAVNAHHGQFDKGNKPYILHPLKVMHYLNTDDEELQCIALGHDLVEDTVITLNGLREIGFSERIIDGIDALTKRDNEPLDVYKQRVFYNVDACRVKMCDLRHNTDIRRLKGVTQKDLDRMTKYHIFYTELITVLHNYGIDNGYGRRSDD